MTDYSETQIESQVRDLFIRNGWYPLKTDAALVSRGQSRGRVKHGTLPLGFPDWVFLLRWPEFTPTFCLAALVELKTTTGRVRPAQADCHAELRDVYGLEPHIVRSLEDAQAIIAEMRDMKARYAAWVKANT